jgi:hypothetical protein
MTTTRAACDTHSMLLLCYSSIMPKKKHSSKKTRKLRRDVEILKAQLKNSRTDTKKRPVTAKKRPTTATKTSTQKDRIKLILFGFFAIGLLVVIKLSGILTF